MKIFNLFIFLTLISNNSFSQKKIITVNKLVDIEIGMTYEKVLYMQGGVPANSLRTQPFPT